MDAFTSFNDLPIQLVAEKPPSIIIVGGRCSSRVAVANRLLGVDVLPPPRCGVAWHTLQFVDTDCVSNFSAGAPLANAAGTKTLWSWFNSVPLVDLEVDSCQETGGKANVVPISSIGFESEFTRTVPVMNILMSHQMLRAGCQMVVCDHSCSDAIQFAVSDVIPIIIFVVTGSELSQTVRAAVHHNTEIKVACSSLFLKNLQTFEPLCNVRLKEGLSVKSTPFFVQVEIIIFRCSRYASYHSYLFTAIFLMNRHMSINLEIKFFA